MRNNNKKLIIEFKGDDQVLVYEGLKLLAARDKLHVSDFCMRVLALYGDAALQQLVESNQEPEELTADGSRDEI